MKIIFALAIAAFTAFVAGLAYGHLGLFNVAADEPHWPATTRMLEWARDRSIEVRAADLAVPDLENPDLLLAGGPDYNEMCAGCHQRPGAAENELAQGLYPAPPDFAKSRTDVRSPAAQFWVIKHGLKMTGMPAWGATHDDARMWAMVAFIRKLPGLSPEQYTILTARAEGDMGHSHMGSAGETDTEHGHGAHAHAGRLATAEQTLKAFHAAMKAGEIERVKAFLLPEVQIYEGGGAERSREEYVRAHLPGDVAHMQSAKVDILRWHAKEVGDAAWILSEARISGTSSKGKPFDVLSTETAVLHRLGGKWLIAHLHWSSHPYGESH